MSMNTTAVLRSDTWEPRRCAVGFEYSSFHRLDGETKKNEKKRSD